MIIRRIFQVMSPSGHLVREDLHGRTVIRRALVWFGLFLVFLGAGGYWEWFLELYGYTLEGEHFASRFFVLSALLACQAYLHMRHRIAYESFAVSFFMYLSVFGGLTLLLPYRDDSQDFLVDPDKPKFLQNLIEFIPAECRPYINLSGVVQSKCPIESVNLLWFFMLGLPYEILGINGLGADFFTGLTFLSEERSATLGFFFLLRPLPFVFLFVAAMVTLMRVSVYAALRWGGAIVFLFFYHGYMGGGAFAF